MIHIDPKITPSYQGPERPLLDQNILKLPSELIYKIFSQLPSNDVGTSSLVCRSFKTTIYTNPLLNMKRSMNFFGAEDWNKYFGYIGVEPPLSSNIEQRLNAQCAIWPTEQVKDTHLLILVPQTINGRPLTFNSLEELIKSSAIGYKTQYRRYWDKLKNEKGSNLAPSSHWVLLTRAIIPNSRNISYEDQIKLVARWAQSTGNPWTLPIALDATVAILMHYVQTGEYLYTDDKKGSQWTWTRCQDMISELAVAIGGFGSDGIGIVYSLLASNADGVGIQEVL